MSEFGDALRELREQSGMNQQVVAARAGLTQSALSRLERGSRRGSVEVAQLLDAALHTSGTLQRMMEPAPAATGLVEPVTSEYVHKIHADIAHIVELDGQHGGADLVAMAKRLFRKAQAKMTQAECPAGLRSDFAAATAELGEVAGWLAFDARDYEQAQQLSTQAIEVARTAGDRDMELFLLGNLSLTYRESGKAREAVATARYMQTYSLSPRLQAMTLMREARALADLGDPKSVAMMARARSLAQDGVRDDDPVWAWWINDREMAVQQAGVQRVAGNLDRAVDGYAQAWEVMPESYPWGRLLASANLADVLIQTRQFAQAQKMAEHAQVLSWEVATQRGADKLSQAVSHARIMQAPEQLVGALSVARNQAASA